MRYLLYVVIISIICSNFAISQQEERSERKSREEEFEQQQSASDSTKFVLDTINLWRPIPTHNSLSLSNLINKININKKELLTLSYFSLSDILNEKYIGFPHSTGFPALNNSAIIMSGLPNGIDLRYNNNPQEFSLSGNSFWSLYPIENIENIEIVIGSQAFILGNNSNGTLINLQEIQHHTYKPYTKLWYNQAIDETIATDGLFSQNFAKNFNILFGFRSIFSPGTYDNQWIESWNVRVKIRWNIDSLTNISLSENFSNYGISESGGINRSSSEIFNPLSATPILRYGDMRLFQHNIILSLSKYLDENKNNSFASSFSLVFNDYTFHDREGIVNNPIDSNYQFIFNYSKISNNTNYEFDSEYLDFKIGEDVSFLIFDKNNNLDIGNYLDFGFYGLSSINLSDIFKLSGGARLFKKYEKEGYAFGGRVSSKINELLSCYIDASIGTKLPSIMEAKQAVKEIHNLFIFGIDWNNNHSQFNAMAYYRHISNPVRFKFSYDTASSSYKTEFYNLSDKNYPAFELNTKTSLWGFDIETKINLNFENLYSPSNQDFPLFYGNIRLFYTITSGESYIKIGLMGDIISSFRGLGYFPLYAGFYTSEYKSSMMGNGLDAFAHARLGNAYLKVRFNNLLNQSYYYTPIYPEPGRHFQFSFSWAFLD